MKHRLRIDRCYDPLTLERWQLGQAVTGGRSHELLVFLAAQAASREGREFDTEAFARAASWKVQEVDDAMSWLQQERWIVKGVAPAPRPATGVQSVPQEDPGKAPAGPVAASGLGAVTTRPKRKRKPAPEPGPSPEAVPAEQPAEAEPPAVVALSRWCGDLAAQLVDRYPHGITEAGLERPAPRLPIQRKLQVIMSPLEPPERDALARQILDGARLMAEAYAEDLDARRFVPLLATWVNQRRWESPPRAPRGGKHATVARNERMARQDAERRVEGYEPRPREVDPALLEEARRRREQAVRDAHRVDAARTEAGHDA